MAGMSSDDEDPVAWLRAEIGSDLGRWRATAKGLELDLPLEAVPYLEAQDHAARCEAGLAVLDECDKAVRIARTYKDATGTLALAEAKTWLDAVRLLASGYRHRPGYREEWKP